MKGVFYILVAAFLYACADKQETIRPAVQNITESVYASGIVKSKDQYEVFAPVNGIIQDIPVSEGDLVQKGTVLFQLVGEIPRLNTESARLAAEYSSVRSNLDRLNALKQQINFARAKMQQDSVLFRRQQDLWADGIGSRNELEQRELAWKNAATDYQSLLLQYRQQERQVQFEARQSQKNTEVSSAITNDYTVKARQDGKLYRLLKEPGEMVNTQTPVAVIGDAREFLAELQVDEYDIGKLRPGQKVFISMDSYKGQIFEATLSKIGPMMDSRSRSFQVEAVFTTPPPRLYPNLTVEANILISTKEKALTIPRTYLTDDNYVLLANGEKRKVETGLKDYNRVEILSGLSKEEVIKKPLP